MARQPTPLLVADLSVFARRLARALAEHAAQDLAPAGHVQLQNLIARAAGFRNLQALKAAAPPALPRLCEPDATVAPDGGHEAPASAVAALSDNARRTLKQFDAQGRLLRWPTKYTVQRMAMWVLWTRFDAKRTYTEAEVNAVLRAANGFGDHVTLRRELINHRLMTRASDCSAYRKLPARPDDEVRALLSAWRARFQARRPSVSGPVQPGVLPGAPPATGSGAPGPRAPRRPGDATPPATR
ncbi:DUF2087 domain-containing protein [Pelomonas sp. CA6]|uniref:DUF2087 domain-containing protein n=1 Tax=Pelomonas sp. CA6 TaxID=2907999 RepID=UPI001F4A762F|nr:DUF2087 domain-containing protein [Pelomonas sp. CA6]MCH7342233.1 DUF2087 domain-containing protein [Pelomonas sp. CA6]